jgi:hypothetical protein
MEFAVVDTQQHETRINADAVVLTVRCGARPIDLRNRSELRYFIACNGCASSQYHID